MNNKHRMIRDLIICKCNDYVGWNENSWSDTGKTWSKDPSVEKCENYIYNEIINSKDEYQETENGELIETKHIRLEGSDWLRLVIKIIVESSYRNGWSFPHSK